MTDLMSSQGFLLQRLWQKRFIRGGNLVRWDGWMDGWTDGSKRAGQGYSTTTKKLGKHVGDELEFCRWLRIWLVQRQGVAGIPAVYRPSLGLYTTEFDVVNPVVSMGLETLNICPRAFRSVAMLRRTHEM